MKQKRQTRFFKAGVLSRMAGTAGLAFVLLGQTGCQSTTVAERYAKPQVSAVCSDEDPQNIAQQEEAVPENEIGDSYEDPSIDLEKYREEISRFDTTEDDLHRMYEEIQQLIGTQYRYGGTDENRGMDCSGFVSKVFSKTIGMRLPRSSQGMAQLGEEISKSDLQFGDLIFFKTRRNRISHVGIYIGEGKFAHATRGLGVTYSSLDEDYYRRTYARSRRILNVRS